VELRKASGRALRLALVVLGVFFVVEVVGGILTNSLALLSDAAHLLSDVAAVALALVAQWFARRPASARRSFGYRRVEILAALINGLTLLGVAGYIGYEAWHRLRNPPEVLGWPMVIVAAVGLLAQLLTTLVLSRAKGESLNVRGAYLHAMTDAVQSLGVVVAGVLMILTGWYVVDPIVSLLIGVLIVFSAGQIILEATHVLIEGTPRELDLRRIAARINRISGVQRVTDLHAWTITSGYNALSAHVEATPDAEQDAGYEALRQRLTASLCREFAIHHLTLQIERSCDLCQEGCCDWLEPGATGEKGRDGQAEA
jgi:cobalt-zinc-cadmium efflux system protein